MAYVKTRDFLWDTDPEDLPDIFNTFNAICIFMILGQCWVWRNTVLKIMTMLQDTKIL